jgi:hypothetical protein
MTTLPSAAPSIENIEAVKFPNWLYPRNWDRVCGYLGTAPFVAFYTEETSLIWTDSHLYGASETTYPFFMDAVLYNRQKVGQSIAALGYKNRFPFGKPTTVVSAAQKAVFCLLIDRYDYSAWVARIKVAKQFMRQFPITPLIQLPAFPPSILTQPCFTCTYGWLLNESYEYSQCPDCHGARVVPIITE